MASHGNEVSMNRRRLCFGLFVLFAALAPAPQDAPLSLSPQDLASLAAARVKAGVTAFDLAWLYYSENRIPSEKVYRWSRWLVEAQLEASVNKAGRIAAYEDHLERIKKLETKIRRIRQIGFGDSLDVVEVDFYRKEADFWLAQARAAK